MRKSELMPVQAASRPSVSCGRRPLFEAPLHCEEVPLSPALRRAVEAEANMRSSRGFDEQFWTRLEERRERNATFKGRCQQLLETELSGVAVWRVLGSGTLGAVFPALILAYCTLSLPSKPTPLPQPPSNYVVTPWNQRRFWEEMAWKNPTRPVLVSLMDPNWKGGESCAYQFVV